MSLPIGRDAPFGARRWLVNRVVRGRREMRAGDEVFGAVVVKPIFARLKAGNNRMVRVAGMRRCVLRRGIIATSNMTALGAAA